MEPCNYLASAMTEEYSNLLDNYVKQEQEKQEKALWMIMKETIENHQENMQLLFDEACVVEKGIKVLENKRKKYKTTFLQHRKIERMFMPSLRSRLSPSSRKQTLFIQSHQQAPMLKTVKTLKYCPFRRIYGKYSKAIKK